MYKAPVRVPKILGRSAQQFAQVVCLVWAALREPLVAVLYVSQEVGLRRASFVFVVQLDGCEGMWHLATATCGCRECYRRSTAACAETSAGARGKDPGT